MSILISNARTGLTSFPDEIVTETVAILAKRGGGKSNAAVVMAEGMWRHGFQWVAIDPKGDWWGIRSAANGKNPALPVPIFGGRHGDLPLEATAGALMAGLVIERDLTCVLDVSLFSKAEQIRFSTDFATTLWKLIGDAPRPLHLFLEEAEELLPQKVDSRAAPMVGAYSKIAKQGRTAGLGVTLITQRSASLNKDALSQTDTLILFRTASPHDRKAVVAWAEYHDASKDIAASLSELAPGESWILSPGFLGTIARVQWKRRNTFDSGATPMVGKRRAAPVALADIDLDQIRQEMAETVERVEATDPKRLQRRVRELEAALAKERARPAETVEVERVVEVKVGLPPATKERLNELTNAAEALSKGLRDAVDALLAECGDAAATAAVVPRPARRGAAPTVPKVPHVEGGGFLVPIDMDTPKITGGALRMLEALARFPSEMSDAQVATHARLKRSGGTFSTYVSRLTTAGLAVRPRPKHLAITDKGMAFIGASGLTELSGEELRDEWRSRLTGGARRMFDALVDCGTDSMMTREQLADAAGITLSGGTFSTYLSRLRSNGLIEEDSDGNIWASPTLFMGE